MELNRKNVTRILLIIVFAVLCYACVQNFSVVYGGLQKVYSVFSTVIAGFCVAFVLNVILRVLEEKVFFFMDKSKLAFVRKIRRPICLVLTLIIAVGIIAVVLLVIVPEVYETLVTMFNNIPAYVSTAINWAEGLAGRLNFALDKLPDMSIDWNKAITTFSGYLQEASGTIWDTASMVTSSVVGAVVGVVFSVIIAVYILAQKEKISAFTKRLLYAYLSEKRAGEIIRIARMANDSFSNFIRGQVLDCMILAVLCFIGMKIFKFPYAAVISVFIGFTALVPMVGSFVGVVVGALLILFISPIKAVLFVVMMLVIQQIDGTIIYPKIVGKSVGLPGVIVLAAVLIGGNIYGVVGALIATPVGAVAYALVRESMERRLNAKSVPAEESEAETAVEPAPAETDEPAPEEGEK